MLYVDLDKFWKDDEKAHKDNLIRTWRIYCIYFQG